MKKLEAIIPTPLWIEKIYLNKDGIRKEGLMKAIVGRIGRQFRVIVLGENSKIYVIRSQGW
jgi:hypothetical protein